MGPCPKLNLTSSRAEPIVSPWQASAAASSDVVGDSQAVGIISWPHSAALINLQFWRQRPQSSIRRRQM